MACRLTQGLQKSSFHFKVSGTGGVGGKTNFLIFGGFSTGSESHTRTDARFEPGDGCLYLDTGGSVHRGGGQGRPRRDGVSRRGNPVGTAFSPRVGPLNGETPSKGSLEPVCGTHARDAAQNEAPLQAHRGPGAASCLRTPPAGTYGRGPESRLVLTGQWVRVPRGAGRAPLGAPAGLGWQSLSAPPHSAQPTTSLPGPRSGVNVTSRPLPPSLTSRSWRPTAPSPLALRQPQMRKRVRITSCSDCSRPCPPPPSWGGGGPS